MCGSTNLTGDAGDQRPQQPELVHPGEGSEFIDAYGWVCLTCGDCRHVWKSGLAKLTPTREMEAVGAPSLFNDEEKVGDIQSLRLRALYDLDWLDESIEDLQRSIAAVELDQETTERVNEFCAWLSAKSQEVRKQYEMAKE